jgi:hypothetical protein
MTTPTRTALPVLIATALDEHCPEDRLCELLAEAGEVIHGLEGEVRKLEDAIRTHRDQKADDRCWLDDVALYAVLGDGVVHDSRLPPKCDFLQSCARFWEQRQAMVASSGPGGTASPGPAGMTMAQLQAEVERLSAEVKRIRAEVDGYEGFRVGPLASEE